jgi:hypothetical protein
VPGSIVDAYGCPPLIPGDFDHDGDVDQVDFGHMQACLSGQLIQSAPECIDARFDIDTDVDDEDVFRFQQCIRGPNQAADPDCLP